MVNALEMRARAGRVMHSGTLNKEKRKLRVGSVLDHGALSFHSRFFVVEPGLLSWWAEEAEHVASQPPKGTMVLDQMTAISNNKAARFGNQFAFRVDRAFEKQKIVLAAGDREQTTLWVKALHIAGAKDEMELSAGKLGYGFWANNDSFRERENDETEVPTLRPLLTDNSAAPVVQMQPTRGRKLSGDEAAAERFGLNQSLRPILAATGADDAATLSRAVQFLQREGARSLADVAKYGLAEALLPVGKAVPQRWCHSLLSPGRLGHASEVWGCGCGGTPGSSIAAPTGRSDPTQAVAFSPVPKSPSLRHPTCSYPPRSSSRRCS